MAYEGWDNSTVKTAPTVRLTFIQHNALASLLLGFLFPHNHSHIALNEAIPMAVNQHEVKKTIVAYIISREQEWKGKRIEPQLKS